MSTQHDLAVWTDHFGAPRRVATISCDTRDDQWSLAYERDWIDTRQNFALSPPLALPEYDQVERQAYPSHAVRRFIENLLPEGRALDVAASTVGVAKSNIFGLIHALGAETTGAFRFLPAEEDGTAARAETPARVITLEELDQRIAGRDALPFSIWDNRVRMSAAGYQDKLLVFCEGDPAGGDTRMFLPDYPLASTYILKPEPADARLQYMVANEHFCMRLAKALKLPVADVSILRTPRPVLAVARFDRQIYRSGGPLVRRSHLIDCCQALDFPVSFKYERNIGSEGASALYRDGVSLPRLFSVLDQSLTPSAHRLEVLRWALFQLAIGNSDAHGKNISFGMAGNRLQPAPWYDLVSVVRYPVSHELSMAVGDQFDPRALSPFDLGLFAHSCGLPTALVAREAQKLAAGIAAKAAELVQAGPYEEGERAFVQEIATFAVEQAHRVADLCAQAHKLPKDIF